MRRYSLTDPRAQWTARIRSWQRSKFWLSQHWGPEPDQPGCYAPLALLQALPECSISTSQKAHRMSKPSHIAYVVSEPKEGSDRKPIWREIGAVWPHKNGPGFDVVVGENISVTGRIVCTERKEKAEQQQ
jgi:hypothetical protein